MLRRPGSLTGKSRLRSGKVSPTGQHPPYQFGHPGCKIPPGRLYSIHPGYSCKKFLISIISSIQHKTFPTHQRIFTQPDHQSAHIPDIHISGHAPRIKRNSFSSGKKQSCTTAMPHTRPQNHRRTYDNCIQSITDIFPDQFFSSRFTLRINRMLSTGDNRCILVDQIFRLPGITKGCDRTDITKPHLIFQTQSRHVFSPLQVGIHQMHPIRPRKRHHSSTVINIVSPPDIFGQPLLLHHIPFDPIDRVPIFFTVRIL